MDYKNKLEQEKEKLTAELTNLGVRNEATGNWDADPTDMNPNDIDPNDVADRFEDYEQKSALIKPLEARLIQVEEALGRIETGTFGKCTVCNGPIEEERLSANPSATTCMKHLEG